MKRLEKSSKTATPSPKQTMTLLYANERRSHDERPTQTWL